MKTQVRWINSRIITLIILFICLQLNVTAQEGAYWMGISAKNPAIISTPSDWIFGSYSFTDLPYDTDYSVIAVYADMEIGSKLGFLGANYYKEKHGYFEVNKAELIYAYKFNLNDTEQLGVGISGGINNHEHNLDEYSILDPNDPSFTPEEAKYFKGSIGAFYNSKKFDVGISYVLFNELKNNFGGNSFRVDYEYNTITALAAYRFIFQNKLTIEPNFLVDFVDGDIEKKLGLYLEYDDLVWSGYEYAEWNEGHSVFAGVDLFKRFRFGYRCTYTEKDYVDWQKFHRLVLGFRLK